MDKGHLKAVELGVPCTQISPHIKRPVLNSSLRKYAKPIIFTDSAPDETIFKNLAKSFKLRPSLKISNFNLTSSKKTKKPQTSLTKTQVPQVPIEKKVLNFTRILRQNTPTKYRISKKEKLKPMFLHYIANQRNIAVEGRPCSRNYRYPYFETKTPEVYHSRNCSNEKSLLYVNKEY